LKSVARYFHTLRHLRPVQIVGRVRHKLHRPRPDLRPPPAPRGLAVAFAAPVAPAPSMPAADRFRFLNVEQLCATPGDWNVAGRAALWTYNLHYFDDLNAAGGAERAGWHRALLDRWVEQNPPGAGPGWDAYPLSRRIVNWTKWAFGGERLSPAAHASLAVQARWLTQRLEYHLLGNHLFANAKALVFAGLYFEGAEADELLRTGLAIVASELAEQVLEDGAHFELSTMYHAAALEDLLDLINVMRAAGRDVPAAWRGTAARMQRWLDLLTHPDGGIAFFNDAAFGIAPTCAELRAYAARLGLAVAAITPRPIESLAASGYARLTRGEFCLLADVAPIGPDYLPAHAHADTLSFELSIGQQRVLVNSGTSEYGESPERLRQRGTAAHNTVSVDGADSSEVWAGFRVARRARARLVSAVAGPVTELVGEHDGFLRLPGRNLHARRWHLDERQLLIEDRISGRFDHAEAYLHIHPDVQARRIAEHHFELRLPDARLVPLQFSGAASTELRAGSWHPRFGSVLRNQVLVARFAGPRLQARLG